MHGVRMPVLIKGIDDVPREWKPYMQEILEVFQDIHEETPNVVFEIIS